jgi:hypothetical protein
VALGLAREHDGVARGPVGAVLLGPLRHSRIANTSSLVLALKSQDVVVALKIAALGGAAWSYPSLASELGMSASGVHASVRRAVQAGLLNPDERRAVRSSLVEFLVHGLRYAFPPERGPATRGMPTGSSAPPLAERLARRDDLPLVWPHREGSVRGESILPLYPSVPKAASRDPKLYALLAVSDALRTGTAREREVAAAALRELLSASVAPYDGST